MPSGNVPSMLQPVLDHLGRIADSLGELSHDVHACLFGGAAVNILAETRMSADVDVKWSHRVAIPPGLRTFRMEGEEPGEGILVDLGTNFADVPGSIPQGWESRASEIGRCGRIVVRLIDPVDLAVSRVARLSGRDVLDIRDLADRGLVDPKTFEKRLDEAMDRFVGDATFVRRNARDACEIVRTAAKGESRDAPPPQ